MSAEPTVHDWREATLPGRIAALRSAAGPGVTDAQLTALKGSADEWEAHQGEPLVEQGHVARQGFVVLSGTATVFAGGQSVARLGPGSAVWPADARTGQMPISVIADSQMWLLMLAPADQDLFRRAAG